MNPPTLYLAEYIVRNASQASNSFPALSFTVKDPARHSTQRMVKIKNSRLYRKVQTTTKKRGIMCEPLSHVLSVTVVADYVVSYGTIHDDVLYLL